MPQPVSISSRIVEALYCEALVLSDEVRHTFVALSAPEKQTSVDKNDDVRNANSSEGLRTTTRMMHAVAWLLNHRAYHRGELSEFQLRRHARLSPDMLQSEPAYCALLSPHVQNVIVMTVHFYDRLLRLDRSWRPDAEVAPGAISRLRERLESRLAS